jgi:hypothetical protein
MPEKYTYQGERTPEKSIENIDELIGRSLSGKHLQTLKDTLGSIEAAIQKVKDTSDPKYLQYFNTRKRELEVKIQTQERALDLQGIAHVEFDPQNLKIIQQFINQGDQVLTQDINGKNYFIAHGIVNINHETNKPEHNMHINAANPNVNTYNYLLEQIKLGLIPQGDLTIVSCHIGEMDNFDQLVLEASSYGVNLQRIVETKGVVEMGVTEKNPLEELRNKSKPANNIVYFGQKIPEHVV